MSIFLIFKKKNPGQWKMSFGQWEGWSSDDLPDVLKPFYKLMKKNNIINGGLHHYLTGDGEPSKEVIEAISKYFNQYLELQMPFGQDSFVWPSLSDTYEPIRCPSDLAITHFHCDL